MAEYIDRNLIEWYGCDFEDGSCEHRECSECSQAECSHTQVMQIPTVQAIPLDKVKQARRELDKLPIYGAKFTDDFRIHLDREEVFAILDKLIESEDKE